ncbi:MAG: type II toxin-antitoxin system antitoxin [Gemmatimonadaceae bacterium]
MPRKPFLLRIDDQLLAAIQRWAAADMRSLNGQIEYLLRDALRRGGRLPTRAAADEAAAHESEPELE